MSDLTIPSVHFSAAVVEKGDPNSLLQLIMQCDQPADFESLFCNLKHTRERLPGLTVAVPIVLPEAIVKRFLEVLAWRHRSDCAVAALAQAGGTVGASNNRSPDSLPWYRLVELPASVIPELAPHKSRKKEVVEPRSNAVDETVPSGSASAEE